MSRVNSNMHLKYLAVENITFLPLRRVLTRGTDIWKKRRRKEKLIDFDSSFDFLLSFILSMKTASMMPTRHPMRN